jgi:rhodanese-related sulfurtransferase
MKNLSQTDWCKNLKDDKTIILDVRTPREWTEGIIEGAIMIDIMDTQSFIDQINKLDKTKNYYVYCRSGGRSEQACQYMTSQGFNEANNLTGGVMEWKGEIVQPN